MKPEIERIERKTADRGISLVCCFCYSIKEIKTIGGRYNEKVEKVRGTWHGIPNGNVSDDRLTKRPENRTGNCVWGDG